jgi:hypothetical protein
LSSNTLTATSAQLAAALTDETGTGSVVFSASPTFTGTPAAPTAAAGTNTTQLATTAHVFAERANTVTLTNKTINLANNTLVATSAQLATALTDETGTGSVVFSASPALTGTPTAPTAAADTNTTQIATTAYVFAERANTATLTNKTINLANNTLTATSAQLATAITDETGTGALVFGTNPTITGGTVNPTTLTEASSPVVVQSDIGTAPNEIPLNQYLGSMAYEDHDSVAITGGVATLSNATLANATIAAGTATLSSATVTTGVLTTADITTLRQTTEISTVEPTLNLNFARSKTLDPRVTFVRASEGRFWDGKTFAKAEENLLLQSQTFETANWAPTAATVTANTTAAPDGTTTADTLTAQASASIHVLGQGVGGSTLDRVFSVFAKAGTHNFVQFCFAGDGVTFANFDLGSGVVGTKAAAATSSITSLGNGWYRCTIGFVSTTSLSVEVALVASASAVRRESWTAAGTETIFIWGAQLEQRSAVTAYTPTTTAPITRYQPQLMTAPSGTPRFDHNPVTGESLGLLIEESRTNLLLRSQEFENATWDKSINISAASNVGIAPDGTLTADKLIATTTNAFHGAFQLVTKAATATTYTFSAYAKIDDAITTRIRLQPQSGANAAQATFDLAAQSASTALIGSGWVLGATSITPVGNGWLRLAFTFTTDATTNVNPAVYVGTPSSFSYTGDGFSGIYIWGAQLEAGAFPTSYIPTVAAQVTRQADAASMTGTNFSSWYRQDEGTLYVESVNAGGVVGGTFGVSDGTNNNRMFLQSDTRASTFAAYVQAQGTAQSSLTLSAAATLTSNKLAMAYKTNDLAASRQGGAAATDSSAAIPLVNRATFGWAGVDAAATASGWFRKAAYYPARLANAELQEMTA